MLWNMKDQAASWCLNAVFFGLKSGYILICGSAFKHSLYFCGTSNFKCWIHVQIKVAIIDILIRLSSSVGINLPFLIPSFIILGSLQTYLFQPPLFILHIKHLSPNSIHALHFPACPHLCQPPLHYEYQEIHLSPDLDWQPLCISSLIVVDPTGTSLQTHITQSSSSSWTNGIFSSPPSIRSLSVISFKDS